MPTDYYELLGVSPTASDAVIRAAFRTLVADAMSDQPRFALLTEAFDTLKDPERRARYDRERALRAAAAPPTDRTVAGGAVDITVAGGVASPSGPGTALVPAKQNAVAVRTVVPGTCAACGTATPPPSVWCPECGLRCGTTPGPLRAVSAAPTPVLTDSSGHSWNLHSGVHTVGRERSDIVLADPSVSRSHAKLTVSDTHQVQLEDNGSTNGTRVSGVAVAAGRAATLADGARIAFGNVVLTLSLPTKPGPSPASLPASGERPVAAIGGQPGAVPRLIDSAGAVQALRGATTRIGRKPDCDIVVSGDAFVSGHHARIDWSAGNCTLLDLGSTNGSWVGETRANPGIAIALTDGVTITLGRTRWTFRSAP